MFDKTWLQEQFDFTNEVIVFTGGAGVLGSEMVRALLGLGAKVAILTRRPERAEDLLKEAPEGRLRAYKSDVGQRDILEDNAEQIQQDLGQVTTLINAAGGNQKGATTSPTQSFFDLPQEALQSVVSVNLLGTILPCQVFGRAMAEQKRGNIINISSMAAFKPLTKIPAYASSKAGMTNFTQWLSVHMAQEYAAAIRVNAIAPGFFLTEQNRFLLLDEEGDGYTPRGQSIIDHTPMGRLGDPKDLISTLLWLLSPASAFVTGIVVPVDGGFSAFGGI